MRKEIEDLEKRKLLAEIQNTELDHAVKLAQKNKLLAETTKTSIEIEQASIQLAEAKKQAAKPWWLKNSFHVGVSKTLLGAGFIAFYINYGLSPIFNADNAQLKTENARTSHQLQLSQEKRHADSLVLRASQLRLDSFEQTFADLYRSKKPSDATNPVILRKINHTSTENPSLQELLAELDLREPFHLNIHDSSVKVTDDEVTAYVQSSLARINGNACQQAHY